MFQKHFKQLNLWQFYNFSKYPEIAHYVSGREGGVSKDEVGQLNLSFKVNDEKESVQENRKRLAAAFDLDLERLVFPSQTHSINVKGVFLETKETDLEDTDAIVTNQKGVLISVMSADCVPILLFDPITKSIGAVHAGWKGTVGKILTETVMTMRENYQVDPQNLIAGIGPSICPEVYEVGEEVIEKVHKTFGSQSGFLLQKERKDKAYLNLWEINRMQLIDLGVPEASIEIAGICTYSNSDKFFSARKSGNKAGRFAAGIMIR